MDDNLFDACSNLIPSEGQLLSEEKVKKIKKTFYYFVARVDKIVYFLYI